MARRSSLELDFQQTIKKQPFTLQHLCRKVIIISTIKSVGLRNVHWACSLLPIPRILVEFLTNSSRRAEDFDIRTWSSLVQLGYTGKCLLYGELVILKCIDLRRKLRHMREEALRFKETWMGVKHDNISRAIVCFEENDIIGAIFEPDPPSLYDKIAIQRDLKKPIEEHTIWKVLHQLCKALIYLSTSNITLCKVNSKTISITANWDVKLQNLLMHFSVNESLTPLQELYYGVYLAPERIEGRSCRTKQDPWLLGCIGYEMVHMEIAFHGREGVSLFETLNNIVEGVPPPKLYETNGYSRELITLVQNCLTPSQAMRPSLEEIHKQTEVQVQKWFDRDQEFF